MPSGAIKSALYSAALPILGKRCEWRDAAGGALSKQITHILKKHHVVGACVQRIKRGELVECYTAGNATLEPVQTAVTADTVFRTASIAKLVTAMLVFRLQTLGKLDVCEDVSALIGYPVRNPYCPDAPITLGMLMSHSSSIVDSEEYFSAFTSAKDLRPLLSQPQSYAKTIPGMSFQYSNLAAGMIGSLLEMRFGKSFEALIQRELFEPLQVSATFDANKLTDRPVADSYRVLPPELCFIAQQRVHNAVPLDAPCPERHFLLASGNLYITVPLLARLALVLINGRDGFISPHCLHLMKSRVIRWPNDPTELYHGMGVLQLTDKRLCPQTIYGHQGIAYGSVNGVFVNDSGNGYAVLDSGASELRQGHLTRLNRDLIALMMNETETE